MSSGWRSYLIRIGERCPEYGDSMGAEEHIETCCNVLIRDIRTSGDDILNLLMECAEELPHKDALYGALVGLINLEDANFVAKVVKHVHDALQDALGVGNCNKLRIMLRFLSVLMSSNVISPEALVGIFGTLLSSAATTIDEDKGNPAWQPRADFYIFCILASLPWCGLELTERAPEELEQVLAGVEAYLKLRRTIGDLSRSPFRSSTNEEKMTSDQDFMEDLWSRIQVLPESGWKVESVPRPHLSFEARLVTAETHDLGSLVCPDTPSFDSITTAIAFGRQWQEAEEKYPQRMRRLHIFPSSKSEEKMAPIDRFVVEEYLLDVLHYLNGCRKECATYMVGLPVPFRYEYLMAETVFSQLLLLPKPPFKLIYYTVVMIDLCKALPGAFPAVVAGAVRSLFSRVDEMDVECRMRLIQWLSHHLSNFQFVWPWEEWAYVLDQPKWSQHRVFAQEVLEKEVRLAYWEKIKLSIQSVPKLVGLLPPKNTPSFKYSGKQPDVSETELALSTELLSMIKAKKTVREIQAWIEGKMMSNHELAIEVVVQCLLHVGSKSFTHLVTVLEKYGQLVSKLAIDQTWQVVVVEAVARFWKNSSQMTAIVIDRMMGYRLLSNLAIVKWVFSEANLQSFHTSDRVWEVLQNALSKTTSRTSDLRKEVISARKYHEEAIAATVKAQTNLETAQGLLETSSSEDSRVHATAKVEFARSMLDKKKEKETSNQESLEAKEALLARALYEQEGLFILIFQSFASVITQHILVNENEGLSTEETMDVEGASEIEVDESNIDGERRNQRHKRLRSNGAPKQRDSQAEEQLQWQTCTLEQLQAIARHYSAEVWLLAERLDAEVLGDDVHPSVVKALYSGLNRPQE
ncbi:hypothetical protein O6H91_04G091800 [Diphasiastrum complanatum]|uniref:Uncharacterized protein n=1 Tax=Diphasiastrum complanatum TaxID=34168 RepID=A0ACC2DYZ9_DIPCM|nr:hypothetical protein O6H91_04G091800 [Diphasiastrum complanatum]